MTTYDIKYLAAMISIVVVAIAAISAAAYTSLTRNQLMAKDLQVALDKGVNPIVIRCAYADEGDRICLVYAAGGDERRVTMLHKTTK